MRLFPNSIRFARRLVAVTGMMALAPLATAAPDSPGPGSLDSSSCRVNGAGSHFSGLISFGLALSPGALQAQAPSATSDSARSDSATTDSVYEYGARTQDGTGKYYLGREISLVMGHQGAGWLERPERERQERTDLFIERVPLESDHVVADIGAGTGYFAFPIAQRVPEGRVLAVDIQPEMLSIIEERKRERQVDNVETVQGTVTDPGLPEGQVDLIYIVDAYHEFSHPREMGEAMFDALKPGGRLILLEYRAEDPTVPIKPLHKMTEEQARREMAVLGFEWVRTEDYLPQQHVLVFEKP